jgi:hypothetical protein
MLLMDANGGLCMAIVWFQMQTSTLHAGLVEQVGRICPVPGMLESWLHQPLGNISMWWLFEFV